MHSISIYELALQQWMHGSLSDGKLPNQAHLRIPNHSKSWHQDTMFIVSEALDRSRNAIEIFLIVLKRLADTVGHFTNSIYGTVLWDKAIPTSKANIVLK